MKTTLLIGCALIVGCASTSDVVSTGRDTYMVSAHGVMGYSSGPEQKAKAFREADAYCGKLGKSFQTVNAKDTPSGFGQVASGEVEFRCIAK